MRQIFNILSVETSAIYIKTKRIIMSDNEIDPPRVLNSVSLKKEELVQALRDATMADPLQESSKHFRKGLVLSGFIAVVIGSFSIQFESFLGFKVTYGSIGPAVIEGLLFLVVFYYFVSYCVNLVGDILGWNFRRERIKTEEYVRALCDLKSEIKHVFQGLDSANDNFKHIYSRQEQSSEALELFRQELIEVRNKLRSMDEGFVKVFKRDQQILRTIGHLNLRSKLKITGMIVIDFLFPMGIAFLALAKTWGGVSVAAVAIFGNS